MQSGRKERRNSRTPRHSQEEMVSHSDHSGGKGACREVWDRGTREGGEPKQPQTPPLVPEVFIAREHVVKRETGGRMRALEGLTEPFSITRLSMTTPLLFCSHTISQKWPHVLGRGPCKQSTKGRHLNSSQVISTTSWTPPQFADRTHYQVLRGLFHNSAWHRADQ